MEDPDEVWQQVRGLNAAWEDLLRRVRAGEVTDAEASDRIRALLWATPIEALAMASRFMRLKSDLRRGRGGR